MRVGLIIGQLSVGGAEGQLRELVRRLDRGRFEPRVYCLAGTAGDLRAEIEAEGVPVRVVGSVGLPRARRLAAALREDRVDLVHSWLFVANTYAAAARLLGARAPLVTSARNCKSQGPGHDLGNIAAFRMSRAIVANSEAVREYIVSRYRAPAPRVRVVRNGVDAERFRPAARRDGGTLTVVGVARMVEQKNPWLFARAAAAIAGGLPNVRFVLAGQGPLRAAIEAWVRGEGLADRIALPGERRDVERLLCDADVFWLTSSWEGSPNVVLEAMASGLPVVATDVGGTRELLRDGSEGFLARPGCLEDFIQLGGRLLRDTELRFRMAAAARGRALEFSMDRMVAEMHDVYQFARQPGGGA